MTQETASPVWRYLLMTVLAVATLGFGAAGLCGAAFTIVSLPQLSAGGPDNFSGAALVIAVPSLLIGGGLAWWCGRVLWRLASRKP